MSDTAGSDVEPIVDILEACICMLLIKGYCFLKHAFSFKHTSNLKYTYYFEINHPQSVKLDFCFKQNYPKF